MFRRSEVLLLTIILLSGLVTKSIAQVVKISPTNVAIGVDTVNVHTALHATKGALLFQGTSGQTPISGEGNRFMWVPFKAAFRAGQVSNTQWDAEHIGFFSFVGGGQNNMASGYAAFIGGGNNNTALADHSFIASGTDNMASGETSFIGGGTNNKASGTRAFVGGGLNNEASNELTFVGGGYGNKATGLYSIVASGENNQSAGRASFVGGGESNQTEGIFTFIGGGISNAALGDHSFVGGGRGNTAYSYCEAVFGSFPELDFDYEKDIWKSSDRLFVIANGISKANRSNALTVLKSGYVGFNEKNPDTRLHIKQEASQPQEGLRIEGFYNTQDSTDTYWDIWNAGDDLQFYFNGIPKGYVDSGTAGFITSSDLQLKQNIQPLEKVIPRLMQLNPASYYYKDVKSPTRPAWGFVAQEVQKIFPELVHQSMDYMGLNYNDFAVMAIKGLQEQQQEISTLKLEAKRRESENKVLQNRLSELEVMVQKLMDQKQQKEAVPLLIQSPSLGQNSPNPASEMTRVEYFLPKGKSGELRITNIKGQHLKQIILPKTGKGYVDLQTHNLPAGTYTYSLIINGQTIDTKRMVLNH